MQLQYDPHTSTIYDAATGAAVAVLYDDLPAAQRHPLGHAMAAALTMMAALAPFASAPIERATKWAEQHEPWPDSKVLTGRDEWLLTVGMVRNVRAALRAAEPPR